MLQDVSQMCMDQITERLPGIIAIHDNICVYGKTQQEHDKHLLQLMKSAAKQGLIFNSNKCHISQPQITSYGTIFSAQGMKPDPIKIQALQDLPAPQTQKQLHSFLELVNYLQPFLPCIASKTTFLWEQISQWDWNPSTDNSFQKLKQWICNTLLKTTLTYYDTDQPLTFHTDASKYGLGAALLQNNKPIAFASKTLTNVETCYANIERDCLSVVFGLERFHTHICRRHITVYNGHKPLEMITKKPIHAVPPHLQCMLLRLQCYNYTLQYKPGKEMSLADWLSRFPSRKENSPIELHQSIQHISFTPNTIHIICGALERDPILSMVYCLTLQGWPGKAHEVSKIAQQFWGTRDKLSIQEGLLIKGDRICISHELHNRFLHDLHKSHQEIEKMQLKARAMIHWPGIDANKIEYMKRCNICLQHKAVQPIQPLLPWDVLHSPWQDLATDFFQFNNKEYLLISNVFSKFPFIFKVTTKTADMVISRLEQLISQYGYSFSLSTDNGPPFSSVTFAKFLTKNKIDHITSLLHYPKSNGYIECQVKTIKTAPATAEASGKTLDKVLLNIRSTPIGSNLPSPQEILHNCTEDRPGKPSQPVNFEQIRNYLIIQKEVQKDNYDQRHQAKPLPELWPGQEVLFLNPAENKSKYIQGTILSPSSTTRSYKIEANGRIYCHTRQHICRINVITPFTRPCATQCQKSNKQCKDILIRPSPAHNRAKIFITGPSAPPKSVCNSLTRPPLLNSSKAKTVITGPSTTNTAISKCLVTRPLSSLVPSDKDLLSYLIAVNSPHILPPASASPSVPSTPSTPTQSVSPAKTPSTSRTSSLTPPTCSSSQSSDEDSDTHSASSRESKISIESTTSDR